MSESDGSSKFSPDFNDVRYKLWQHVIKADRKELDHIPEVWGGIDSNILPASLTSCIRVNGVFVPEELFLRKLDLLEDTLERMDLVNEDLKEQESDAKLDLTRDHLFKLINQFFDLFWDLWFLVEDNQRVTYDGGLGQLYDVPPMNLGDRSLELQEKLMRDFPPLEKYDRFVQLYEKFGSSDVVPIATPEDSIEYSGAGEIVRDEENEEDYLRNQKRAISGLKIRPLRFGVPSKSLEDVLKLLYEALADNLEEEIDGGSEPVDVKDLDQDSWFSERYVTLPGKKDFLEPEIGGFIVADEEAYIKISDDPLKIREVKATQEHFIEDYDGSLGYDSCVQCGEDIIGQDVLPVAAETAPTNMVDSDGLLCERDGEKLCDLAGM